MKVLIFVTGEFPYGNGETFVENEIIYLSKYFDKVAIFASQVMSENGKIAKREFPDNVIAYKGLSDAIEPIHVVTNKNFVHEAFQQCFSKNAIGKLKSDYDFVRKTLCSEARINEFIEFLKLDKEDKITVYSYWLYTIGAVALSICNRLEKLGYSVKKVARTHRFDLYSERNELNYLPFQREMLKGFDSVFPCSYNGKAYLKNKYPQYDSKIQTAYLGVIDRFEGKYPALNRNEFTVVSCSNIVPVKRVELLVKALGNIKDIPIRWIHFGDGALMESVRAEAARLSPNIRAEFPGRVKNTAIYDFYKVNNVNLFVNVSSSEGLPVSIMEAFSFGIPVIATDVGGTGEIVNEAQNGYLIPENFETGLLAEKIRQVFDMPDCEYSALCNNAREKYAEKFSAEKNYKAFAAMLLEEKTNG